jgi:acyl-CoA thioesterase-1
MKTHPIKCFLFFLFFLQLQCYHSEKDDLSALTLLSQNSSPVRITILGDSLSQWSDSFGLKQKLNASYLISDISIAGHDSKLWLEDLSKAEAIQTDIWIIELGTNDASYYGTTDFKERYSEILRRLEQRSYSYFILSAVPKTNQVGLQSSISINNEIIRDIVKINPKYRLADLETIFTKAANTLTLYSLADPIHPNRVGYELIGEEYRRILLGL